MILPINDNDRRLYRLIRSIRIEISVRFPSESGHSVRLAQGAANDPKRMPKTSVVSLYTEEDINIVGATRV